MPRVPFQILVILFKIKQAGIPEYCLFKRDMSTGGYWQGIAGGGEDNETIIEAAFREVKEEAEITSVLRIIELDSKAMIPRERVGEYDWDKSIKDIPEYCFGFEIGDDMIKLSNEHSEYRWLSYEKAKKIVHWESNKQALTELNSELSNI